MSTANVVPKACSIQSASPASISPRERERRANAVAWANGHSAMEGQFGSTLLRSLQARYVAGEIDTDDEIRELKRQYAID